MDTLRNDSSPRSSSAAQPASATNDEQSSPRPDVTGPIDTLLRHVGIETVYGAPITAGETTVVPVAELRTGFGYGTGSSPDDTGGGGGAGLRITPRGYLHVTPDGVRYRPIYDVRTLVAGGAVAGWLLYRLLSRWT